MTTIILALDSISPQDSSAEGKAFAKGFAKYLAAQLDGEFEGPHSVKIGDNSDYPDGEYRAASNRAYDDWCGLSDGARAKWA